MEQSASSVLPLVNLITRPKGYKIGALDRDAYRLEVFLAHNGWFDARFGGWQVHRVKEQQLFKRNGRSMLLFGSKHVRGQQRRAGVIEVFGQIDRGIPSTIRSFEPIGFDQNAGGVVRAAMTEVELREGDQFSLEVVELAEAQLEGNLQDRGFGYAEAVGSVQAFPDEHHVDVRMLIGMGSRSTVSFGDVTFSGVDKTPLDKLENMVRFRGAAPEITDEKGCRKALGQWLVVAEPGADAPVPRCFVDPFSLKKVELTRKQLFNTGAFSVVDVVPDLSVRGANPVPVSIEVTETQFNTLRGGVGVEYDGFLLTPRISMAYANVNFLRRLVRLELDSGVGYSQLAGGTGPTQGTVDPENLLFNGRSAVTWPQLIARDIDVSGVVSYDRDLQNGQFLYTNPKVDLGAVWRATEYGKISLGPHWELYNMPDLRGGAGGIEQQVAGEALFGRGFDGRFQLTSLDARVNWDWRNDPINATQGSYWDLNIRQAVPLGKDDFLYTDVSFETRGYVKVPPVGNIGVFGWFTDWTGVARVRARVLKDWTGKASQGQVAGIPYQERLFMGGLQDIRGFRDSAVGPYDLLCLYEPGSADGFTGLQRGGKVVNQRYLARGGVAGASTTFEARKDAFPAYGIGLNGFVDVGVMAPGADDFGNAQAPLYSGTLGVGLSYDSLVGPIRIDLALRPIAANDRRPGEYVNCANHDKEARPYGLFTTTDRSPEYPDSVSQPVIQILFTLSQI